MNRSYIFKHWGCTILLFLIVLAIYRLMKGVSLENVFYEMRVAFPYLLIGLIGGSLPTLIANTIAFRLLDYYRINTKWAKPILISITVIGFGLTSYLILKTIHLGIVLTYSFVAIVCGLVFKVEEK
ncbi:MULTISPECIES: hypothetical protein [Sphingobacterium]|uniref:hypothetical protein n=1 Tax=Sphingobacterium TaxID=28453 RepID=UPI00257E75B2|nr:MULTISPECIES: hypothetical protein [Sphingobacterium]